VKVLAAYDYYPTTLLLPIPPRHLQLRAHACIGGTLIRDDIKALQGGQQLVVGTVGRVKDMIFKKFLKVRARR
jgi:superfamily II DNA/RNA helicase